MKKSLARKSIALFLVLAVLLAFQPIRPALAVISIYITRTDTGETLTVNIVDNITVAELKQTLSASTGIPADCIQLWYWSNQDKDVLKVVVPDDYFLPGDEEYGELGWFLTPTCSAAPKPLYMLWFLTHEDGSRCLIFSPTPPSVETQNAKCFPQEYNNSWVAARSCGAEVFTDGYWECKGDFDGWQDTLPQVLRSGLPTPN